MRFDQGSRGRLDDLQNKSTILDRREKYTIHSESVRCSLEYLLSNYCVAGLP